MNLTRKLPYTLAKTLIHPIHASLISPKRVDQLTGAAYDLIPNEAPLTGLDVGCGTGEIAWNLQNKHSGLTMTGVDTLLRNTAKIHVIQSEASHLPFGDNSFDFVMLIDVLHHTNDPEQFLQECKRVAKKFLIIKDHNCNSFWDRQLLSLMDWVGNKSEGVYLPYNYLSSQQWQAIFKGLNLNPHQYIESLGLYSPVISWIFERKLHFMTKLSLSYDNLD